MGESLKVDIVVICHGLGQILLHNHREPHHIVYIICRPLCRYDITLLWLVFKLIVQARIQKIFPGGGRTPPRPPSRSAHVVYIQQFLRLMLTSLSCSVTDSSTCTHNNVSMSEIGAPLLIKSIHHLELINHVQCSNRWCKSAESQAGGEAPGSSSILEIL